MNNKCPICEDQYTEFDKKVLYHVTYIPEITTYTCQGCNWAEHLIQHPEIHTDYDMTWRKEMVKAWTLKNRPFINFKSFKVSK